MNLPLPEDVLDQMALEQAHFDAAPQAFFEAWKRGAQIAGHEWFGDGTREGLQRATTKWDLRPNMLMLNDALALLGRLEDGGVVDIVAFEASLALLDVLKGAGVGDADELEALLDKASCSA